LLTNGVNVVDPSNFIDNMPVLDGIIFHDIYSFDYTFIFNVYTFSKNIPVYVSDNDKYFNVNSIKYPDMGTIIEMFNLKFEILGKPNPDMINGIIYNNSRTIMIGDSETDYVFSKSLGIDFCHINQSKQKEWIYNTEKKCYEIDNISSLYNYLRCYETNE